MISQAFCARWTVCRVSSVCWTRRSHEFLPDYAELLEEVATLRATGENPKRLEERQALLNKVASLREANPMLGLRGCRLGLEYPEIYEMQVRAILEAALAIKQQGGDPHPEIMIPLVSHANELGVLQKDLERIARMVEEENGDSVAYKFGTMIEVPRAAPHGCRGGGTCGVLQFRHQRLDANDVWLLP